MKHTILATAVAAFSTLTADAALITWGAPQDIVGDSDVSTAGTLVGAFNLGPNNVGSPTVNGVTFTEMNANETIGNFSVAGGFTLSVIPAAAPFSSLSADYQALLGPIMGGGGINLTLTMSGLTVGESYEFQWWSSGSGGLLESVTRATAGNFVDLDTKTPNTVGGIGQYAVGTFVADSTTQQVVFSSVVSNTIVNGFQLRNVTSVPEPGTALAGVMLAGLLGLCRRRH